VSLVKDLVLRDFVVGDNDDGNGGCRIGRTIVACGFGGGGGGGGGGNDNCISSNVTSE
jgi:hypothetical protein